MPQESFGLEFIGQREPINLRSGLDLSYNDYYYINSEFSLSFDLAFLPEKDDYFGYVLRIIADDHNIDLIYRPRATSGEFYIVYGVGEKEVMVESDQHRLFEHWNRVEFKFDPRNDKLEFEFNDRKIDIDNIGVRNAKKYKFLFGVNTFGKYATTDLPPMKLREVRINVRQKEKYYWPLNENSENITRDVINGKEAFIVNPLWLKPLHTTWTLALKEDMSDGAQVAFDSKGNKLYLISRDYNIEYDLISRESRRISYSEGNYLLVTGGQVIYDTVRNELYSYSIDRRQIFSYDFNKNRWIGQYADSLPLTLYWHHNKFLLYPDTSIYIFNGYGQLRYRNAIFRISLNNNSWKEVSFTGDTISPRYLAGLGYNDNQDSVYIAGGYGSDSGDQLINPHGYSDLYLVEIGSGKIKKLFEFTPKGDDEFCFASNLIIDDTSRLFYGLIYPKNRPNDRLQLIEASLDHDEYRYVGSSIPYRFYDIVSSANLFFARNLETLIAVNQQEVDGKIQLSVFTLKFPPATLPVEVSEKTLLKYFALALFFLLLSALIIRLFIMWKKKISGSGKLPKTANYYLSENEKSSVNRPDDKNRNAILLFGGFRVFNRAGVDDTHSFTPLLTRLFLSILLNSFKETKGLTSGMLRDLIWSGKPERNARNTMAVNMIRLRRIVEGLDRCQISNESGFWKFEFDPAVVYIDYYEYIMLTEERQAISREQVIKLIKLFHPGPFLQGVSFDGVDSFKAEVSDTATEILSRFGKTLDFLTDADLIIEICNTIFIFDPVDEEAIILKCQILLKTGKHSLAVKSFEKFKKQYAELYGEEFARSYQEIFGMDPSNV